MLTGVWLLFMNRVYWSTQLLSSLLNWWLIPSFSGCHTISHLIVSTVGSFVFLHLDQYQCHPHAGIGGKYVGAQTADLMATLYDVGGIFGKACLPLSKVHSGSHQNASI